MLSRIKAKDPFIFFTRLHLSELMGLKAKNLEEFLEIIKNVPTSCIYHHTHRFLQQHLFLSPEPPNDFAYWVTEILGEDELGEELASIDTFQYSSIRSLREKLVKTIEDFLVKKPSAKLRFADEDQEFYFQKSISFILQTNFLVYDLEEFLDVLKKITINSIYFHIFEARLRLEHGDNDFSNWIEDSIGDKKLADEISKIDPYTITLDNLRKLLIKLIEMRIRK